MPKSKRVKQDIACTYDFIKHTDDEAVLSKDGNMNKMNVAIIRGFNEETFTEMGEKGYLRGKAKLFYEKGNKLFKQR